MFTQVYKPKKLDDFIGNRNAVPVFEKWLLEWNSSNKKTKCAIVSGKNGVGKSILVELVLEKRDYHFINLSNDDERDKKTFNTYIKPFIKTKTALNGKKKALIVSDVDASSGDHGFISTLVECIKETEVPIICICDDRYCQNIKPILNYCFDVKLSIPSYDEMYKLVCKVVTAENIKIGKSILDKLIKESNGDIRFVLNNLQLGLKSGHCMKNIQNSNIFETTGKLFDISLDIDEKIRYFWMANDIHTLMVHENFINNTLSCKEEHKKMENISYSADSLSDADIFDAVFDFDLANYSATSVVNATTKCSKKGMIKFPQFLGKTATKNKNKREKIGKKAKKDASTTIVID
jgi:replication factor C subunit 1